MSRTPDAGAPLDPLAIELGDEAATRRLGENIAIVLRTGDAVALSGDLGAGKSTLARAIVRWLAGDGELEVPSPTYTLAQGYETRPKVTHFDLYRIADEDEVCELGFEEAAETGIVLVEWPERAAAIHRDCNLRIALEILPGGGRLARIDPDPEIELRLARSFGIRRFLEASGQGQARREPFPADASARRYETVETDSGDRLVLMDAPRAVPPRGPGDPPSYAEIAHIAQEVLPFVALDEALQPAGFSVPRLLAHDLDAGLVLMEHLGSEGILDAAGAPIPERYEAAAHCLAQLHETPFDPDLATSSGRAYRVPPFDRGAMAIEIALLLDWYLPSLKGRQASPQERARFEAVWSALFDKVAAGETNLLLRDFHSPNILWKPEREGCARIGILDFQDAMIGPTAYDLASLAQDARADVPAELEARLVSVYGAARQNHPAFDPAAFATAYAVMAAQRATKILGIFVRLHERDGKPQYRRHIPRIQAYLRRTLAHPSLAELRALYEDWNVLDPDAARRQS